MEEGVKFSGNGCSADSYVELGQIKRNIKNSDDIVDIPIAKYRIRDIVLHIIILIILALLSLYYQYVAKAVKRGFFCNDESIKSPYKEDTISNNNLYIWSGIYPGLFLLFSEILLWFAYEYGNCTSVYVNKYKIPSIFRNIFVFIGGFLYSQLITSVVTNGIKPYVGRLRPHFLTVCNPDYKSLKCMQDGMYIYVDDYTCLGHPLDPKYPHMSDRAGFNEPRLSFPSGHSSQFAAALVFVLIYIQARYVWHKNRFEYKYASINNTCCVNNNNNIDNTSAQENNDDHKIEISDNNKSASKTKIKMQIVKYILREIALFIGNIRAFLQCVCILGFCVGAGTRLSDYKHHLTDVIGGLVTGTAIAFFSGFWVVDSRQFYS